MKEFQINMCDMGYGADKTGISTGYQTIKDYKEDLANKINYVPYEIKPILKEDIGKYEQTVYNACLNVYNANVETYKQGKMPITLGGDHSLALGSVKATMDVYGEKVGLIWIDAHADINTFAESETKNIHGTPVASLIGINTDLFNDLGNKKRIQPENIVYVGTRSVDYAEFRVIAEKNILNISDAMIKASSFDTQLEHAIAHLKDKVDKVFISLDLDSMDPTLIPGVSTPVSHGLMPGEVLDLVKRFNKDFEIVGLDIFEYNPLFDKKNHNTLDFIDSFVQDLEKLVN